jgi:hypothetical protein
MRGKRPDMPRLNAMRIEADIHLPAQNWKSVQHGGFDLRLNLISTLNLWLWGQ